MKNWMAGKYWMGISYVAYARGNNAMTIKAIQSAAQNHNLHALELLATLYEDPQLASELGVKPSVKKALYYYELRDKYTPGSDVLNLIDVIEVGSEANVLSDTRQRQLKQQALTRLAHCKIAPEYRTTLIVRVNSELTYDIKTTQQALKRLTENAELKPLTPPNRLFFDRKASKTKSYYYQHANDLIAHSNYDLGYSYLDGAVHLGVHRYPHLRRSPQLAFYYMHRAYQLGSVDSYNPLAVMYDLGGGTQTDFSKALALYKKAAAAGSIRAKYNLIYHLRMDKPTIKNQQEAFRQLLALTQSEDFTGKHADACITFDLANMYASGKGTKRSLSDARRWYEQTVKTDAERQAADFTHSKPTHFSAVRFADFMLGKKSALTVQERKQYKHFLIKMQSSCWLSYLP
ncbi:MAG: hypothetical protein P1U40_07015 [Coxiellaceae bacterium]|nr:hypothetical protein [Coxiellaceae bacterium]